MKYFILIFIFIFLIILFIIGIIFYNSYNKWLDKKQEVLGRLYYLKEMLKEAEKHEVDLAPDLSLVKGTIIYDYNGKIIGEISPGRRKLLPLYEIPPLLVQGLILMEDKKFYQHRGFVIRSIMKALFENIRTISFSRGGSTISQQLAKVLFTDSKKTFKRKLFELFCTIEIEKRFTKDEILALYLNSIYFGHNTFGIEDAARFYFNKGVFDLDVFEVSLLIGMIPNPTRYSPIIYPERSQRKHKIILNTFVQNGYADAEYIKNNFNSFWDNFIRLKHPPNLSIWVMEKNMAPYFNEYVRSNLEKILNTNIVRNGGLRVFTTLDIEKQLIAQRVMSERLKYQNKKTLHITGKDNVKVEGALVALNPKNGYIVAMVGGSGFTFENQFNRATHAKRQLGSAFKPFVYAAAVETKGYNEDTVFIDRPLKIKTKSGLWSPSNYNNQYYGKVSLSTALKLSLNSVSVQLVLEIGLEKIIDIISRALSLDKKEASQRFEPYPSIALGVYSFSPLEVATAYSIFPNDGERIIPVYILRVEDQNGNLLVNYEKDVKKSYFLQDLNDDISVIKKSTAETINHMLEGVLQEGGTAHRAVVATELGIKASGKTGTTNNYTDAWFIGYTDEILTSVWVGFDDPSFTLGNGQSGGVVAAPIWADFMKYSLWRK